MLISGLITMVVLRLSLRRAVAVLAKTVDQLRSATPQNLAIGAAAVGLAGREGDIFRRVIVWSLSLLLFMCVLVYLQSTDVLGWMVG